MATTRTRRTTKTADEAEVVEILPAPIERQVMFWRDDDEEPHTFRARPRLTYKRMSDMAKAEHAGGAERIRMLERMIRPSLVDDDGTPAKWQPEVEEGEFVDPSGDTRPVSELAALLEFEAGSSRRRWVHLMDRDDEVEIETEEVVGLYEKLVEASSGNRPTRRSSSSSRR